MKAIKKIIQGALSVFGYRLYRTSRYPVLVRFENFVNLARAFEHSFAGLEDSAGADDTRYRLMARLLGTPPSEACFIVQALDQCRDLDGDVCEFGVAQGETSALIANEILPLETKRYHLFDSFEGLPEPTEKDQLKDDIFALGSMSAYAGKMSCPEDMVISRLRAVSFPERRYEIHKGFIEQTIREDANLPDRVSFAYVDFDFYEPIKIALEYLDGVTQSGAKFVVDDYDYFSTGAKAAVDEFLEEKNRDQTRYECLVPDPRYGHFAVLTKRG